MLIENVSIFDENWEYKEGQWIGIKDDTIDFIGESTPVDAAKYGRVYDGRGKLALPGLFNAHAHAPMTLLRGYAENLPLDRWLNEKCWPFEAKMNGEDNYWATLLACAEMARYGVVSFSDMYYFTPDRASAVSKAGLKANLCEGLIAFEDKPYNQYPICAQNEQYVRDLHGGDNGRILIDYCIHAEYTSNPTVVADIIDILKESGLRLHMHLSETQKEVEDCKKRHDGLTPVEYFNSLGAFDLPCTAAHCVWLTDNDLDILQEKNVFIANNPVSNMKLGSGFARIPEMVRRKMNVCVGSDGMASNNNHNLFGDLYVMGLIYKGYNLDPSALHPKELLTAATVTGALSQGRNNCGKLAQGYKADICLMDISGPEWTPMLNPIYNVIFAGDGSNVVLTLCDGEIVYENVNGVDTWPNLDIDVIKAEVAQRATRIISEL